MRLYALLSEEYCRNPWLQTAEMLLEGGVDVIQLREKELEDVEILRRARSLKLLTQRFSALLIINDRPDIAWMADADGVHLGQDDLPVREVRRLLGTDKIIGQSTHRSGQPQFAEADNADYVAVGPVFPTETKGYARGGGLKLVKELCSETELPTVAIGGITVENAADVIGSGATAVAACSALCGAEDPRAQAAAFRAEIESTEKTVKDFHI